jgi:hypothetical protein
MPHNWTTKFKPGDKVRLLTGEVGEVNTIEIRFPDADMDYWEKILPKISEGCYQHTAYNVIISEDESWLMCEDALELLDSDKS